MQKAAAHTAQAKAIKTSGAAQRLCNEESEERRDWNEHQALIRLQNAI